MNEYVLADREDLALIASAVRETLSITKTYSVPELANEVVRVLEQAASGGTLLPSLSNPAAVEDVLVSKEFIDQYGNVLVGTIPVNGDISQTIDGIEVKEIIVPRGYTTGGVIALDNTLDAIAQEQEEIMIEIIETLSHKVNNLIVNGDEIYVENGKMFIS